MLEEKRRAKLLATFGNVKITHDPALLQKIQFSTQVVVFSKYVPGKRYENTLEIINPSKYKQHVRLVPPEKPFYIHSLNFMLMPGERQKLKIFFLPETFH